MHASLAIGGATVMVSDANCVGQAELQRLLAFARRERRGRGGAVARSAFGGRARADAAVEDFGMVANRFGVSRMVIVQP
jgi:uncharacterized glyoxalase superfamily protein PhnB